MKFKSMAMLAVNLISAAIAGRMVARAQEAASPEYAVKAAFLYNFAKFVEWPDTTFTGPDSPFTIGVYGGNPFGNELERAVKDKSINGHPLRVIETKSPAQARTCQILFIAEIEKKRLDEALSATRGASVLTVSDSKSFIDAGGIIGFVPEEGKIHFEINNDAAKRARLKISSKLLSLARRVITGGPE